MKPTSAAELSDGVLALSDGITSTLTNSIARAKAPDVRRIAELIRSGLFEEAKAEVSELEFTGILAKQVKTIRRFTRNSALLGAAAIDSPQTSAFANGEPYPYEVDVASVVTIARMINDTLTRDTRKRLIARINRAVRFQKAAEPIDPEALAKDINRYLRGEIRRVVDVSSNVVGTRVSAFGMLHEARVRGIARYRIDATLDDRTTDICREMNGRIFEVSAAYTRTQEILQVTEPGQLKANAPFPELDKIAGLSNDELQELGHDVPPFHFLCRTVVTMIETKEQTEEVPSSSRTSNSARQDRVRGAGGEAGAAGAAVVTDALLDATAEKLIGLLARPKAPLSLPAPAIVQALPGPLAPAAKELFPGTEPGAPVDFDFFKRPPRTNSDLASFSSKNRSRVSASYGLGSQDLELIQEDYADLRTYFRSGNGKDEFPLGHALYQYSGSAYRRYNSGLREGKPLSDVDQEAMQFIDKALEQAPAFEDAEDLVLYRGAKSSRLVEALEPGLVFQDDGYVSASLDLEVAESFAMSNSKDRGVLFRIKVPDSAPKIYLEELTQNPGETEILMQRSNQFRVVAKENDPDKAHAIIDLVMIGRGEALPIEQVGLVPPVTPEDIVKEEADPDKFLWDFGYLREAYIRG